MRPRGDSSREVRAPTGIISNATVVNRKGIFHATAPKTRATTNRALNKEEGLKPTTTTSKRNPYKRLAPLQKIAHHKNAPMRYWAIWQTKKKQSRTSLLRSSEVEGIFQTPEPDGLGEGFTL